MTDKHNQVGGIILTHDNPAHGLLTQVGHISKQVKVFNEEDDKVVGFEGVVSNKPNMKLFNPTETYINYSDCSKEKEIINLLLIATILIIVFIVVNNI